MAAESTDRCHTSRPDRASAPSAPPAAVLQDLVLSERELDHFGRVSGINAADNLRRWRGCSSVVQPMTARRASEVRSHQFNCRPRSILVCSRPEPAHRTPAVTTPALLMQGSGTMSWTPSDSWRAGLRELAAVHESGHGTGLKTSATQQLRQLSGGGGDVPRGSARCPPVTHSCRRVSCKRDAASPHLDASFREAFSYAC